MATGEIRLITAQFSSPCMTCDSMIHVGEKIYWCKGIGSWHWNCQTPRNLNTYIREVSQKEKLV